jgi:hypothetical protein
VALPKAGDRRMVGTGVGGDDAEGDILAATPLDRPGELMVGPRSDGPATGLPLVYATTSRRGSVFDRP